VEDPIFLDLNYVLEAHRTYFGRELPCNHSLLESAVNAAKFACCYSPERLDLFELAAYYACNISAVDIAITTAKGRPWINPDDPERKVPSAEELKKMFEQLSSGKADAS
jgi:hypothetical protein